MAVVYSCKPLCWHLATGGIFTSLDAGEKEASNDQKIPPVDCKGVLNERVFGAPHFADCCVKVVPKVYGRFQILKKKLNSTLARRLMQDGRSFCTTLLGILDVVDQYQSLTPNLLNHKRLNHHPSVGGINIRLFAAKREKSNDPKIPPVDRRGATI